ncbi:MAG: 4Fe-4S binding protein [Candidatus Heimdallarchaeota archaeon]
MATPGHTPKVTVDERDFSKTALFLSFFAVFLCINYAMTLILTESETLVDLILPVIVFPTILAIVTLIITMRSRNLEQLEKRRFGGYWKFSLTENRLGKWLVRRRWFQFLFEFPNVLFFLLVIATGIYGYGGYQQASDAGYINAATFLTWNIWWVGIIFTFLLFGRLWCLMCPLGCVGEWAHRTHLPRRNQLSKKSLIFRIIIALILGMLIALIAGVTLGLFAGYDAKTLMGSGKLNSDLFKAFRQYLLWVVMIPTTLFRVILDENLLSNNPSDLLFGLFWLVGIAFGFFIGGLLGYALLGFSRAAVVGTPLEQDRDPKREYPKRLRSYWITIILFSGIMVFDFAIGMFVNPLYTALFVVFLIFLSISMGLIYEKRAFCQYICPLAAIIGAYGMTGATEVRNKDIEVCKKCKTKECRKGRTRTNGEDAFGNIREFDYPAGYACPMGEYPMTMDRNMDCIMCFECFKSCPNDNISFNIRPPLVDTYNVKKRKFDQAALGAILVGLTFAIILPSVPEIAEISENIINAGIPESVFIFMWFGFAGFIFPIGSFFLFLFFSKWLGGLKEKSTKDLFKIFAYSIIPIGLSLHLAFWIVRIFEHSPSVLTILADPFGGRFMGYDLFSSSGDLILTNPVTFPIALLYSINPLYVLEFHKTELDALISTDLAFTFRTMFILLGLAAAIYSAYNAVVLNLTRDLNKNRNLRILIPVIIWMILATSLGLWAAHSWRI